MKSFIFMNPAYGFKLLLLLRLAVTVLKTQENETVDFLEVIMSLISLLPFIHPLSFSFVRMDGKEIEAVTNHLR